MYQCLTQKLSGALIYFGLIYIEFLLGFTTVTFFFFFDLEKILKLNYFCHFSLSTAVSSLIVSLDFRVNCTARIFQKTSVFEQH